VVVPTETVYGLAVDPSVPGAMDQLFAAKGRPSDKPVALFVPAVGDVLGRGAGDGAAALAQRYWPGPLTLVLETPQGPTGFRIPDHPVTLALLEDYGAPLAVTSANLSGGAPATTAEEAVEALGASVSLVLDAGPVRGGVPSTVVKLGGGEPEVLREGAIPTEEILAAWRGRKKQKRG
jgi:L-threonylcarbamoyladenylate synthase